MIQYTLSPFTKDAFDFYGGTVFHKNNCNLLLGKNGCVILLSDQLVEQLKSGNPEENLMFKLVQHGLATVPGKVMFRCEKEIEVHYFIIDLTKCCNFDCIYCFRTPNESRNMSFDTLKDVLAYIEEYCTSHGLKRIGIQLWGGEPLLEIEKIRYTVNFFRDSKIRASIDIETNASLITEEMAAELYQMGIHIGISIDGYPAIQNLQRKMATGKESAKAVEKGISNLQKYYGKNFGGISVITKYNYNYISKILGYFIYELGLTNIKFNLVRDNINAKEDSLALSKEEIEFFLKEMMECVEAYRRMGADFTEGNLRTRLMNLLCRSGSSCCISHGCQGGKRIISFDYEGNIYPCEMLDFPEEKLGSIYDGMPLDLQLERAISNNLFFLPKESEKCGSCPWQYYCGGGCSSRNRYLNKSGKIDETECLQNRLIYPQLIEWILDGHFV